MISGYPDFSVGGGRFRHVLKGLKREYKVKRKLPVAFEMMNWIHGTFWQADTTSLPRTELICAVLSGFFFLPRINEIEKLTWPNVQLGIDSEGDQTITVELTKSKPTNIMRVR